MNIAIVSYFKSAYGGNFISELMELANAIILRNHSVIFIFPNEAKEREWCIELSKLGFKIVFIKLDSKYLHLYKELNSIAINENIDILYSHFGSYDVPSALVSLTHNHIKHIIHARSVMLKPKNYRGKIKRLIRNKLVYYKSFVLSVGQEVYNEYIEFGFSENKIDICFNGVDFERLKNGFGRDSMRSRLQIERDSRVFLMMGYNIKIKGVDIVLKAFSKIKQIDKKNNFILSIIVASHYDELAEYLLNNYGEIPEWVRLLPPNENIGEYYRISDMFISASRTEGFSNSIAEAISMSLPVVISDILGTKWALKYKSVLEFKSESSDDLIKKILKHDFNQMSNVESVINIKHDFSIYEWTDHMIKIFNL